ncbi:MAG: hypothetical protein QM534_12495 [Sediminibacterium sp.]|nr:hypothetical protein [Sediminibacterium sp.]
MKQLFFLLTAVGILTSCTKKNEDPAPTPTSTTGASGNGCPTCTFPDTVFTPSSGSGPRLIFKFKFDSTQVRLNNIGQPTVVAPGNAAYSPKFNGMSAHYIELAPADLTPLGSGKVLYRAEETNCGGSDAITFCKSVVVKENEVFYSVPLSQVAGTYKWLRVSLAYQNYDIPVRNSSVGTINGTIASFLGFNTYVTKYKVKGNAVMTPTAGGGPGNHPQGYWGFYTNVLGVPIKLDGQNAAGATTVVNPNPSSPIPAGSCVVTGEFFSTAAGLKQPLAITGNETQDIIITVSLSTNKSFEWKELSADGLFEPEIGELPVDMGIRGMIPKY